MSMFGAPRAVGQRATERRECHVRAQVQFLNDQSPIDCMIINFSSTGVRVRFLESTDLPSRFNLFIPSRPETKPVVVRWRNNLEYGLEYSTLRHREEQTITDILERLEKIEIRSQVASSIETAPDPSHEKSFAAPLIATIEQRLDEMELRLKTSAPQGGFAAPLDDSDASELRSRIDAVEAIAAEATSALDTTLNTRLDDIEARLSNNIVNTGSALGAQVDAIRIDFKEQICAIRDLRNASATDASLHPLTQDQLSQIGTRFARIEENLSQTEGRVKKDMTTTLSETQARIRVLEGKADEFSVYLQTTQTQESGARRLTLEMLEGKLKQAFQVEQEKDDAKTDALNERLAALEAWTRENGTPPRAIDSTQSNIVNWQSEAFSHTLKALEEKISGSSHASALIIERLATMERLTQSYASAIDNHAQDLTQIKDELLKAQVALQDTENSTNAIHSIEDYTAVMDRLSNLEVGMLDLRIKQPSAPVQIETFSVRLQKLEERNQTVMELLKHLLTHLEHPKERSIS